MAEREAARADTPQPSIDELLTRSIARWGVFMAACLLLFDLLVLRGYPFPFDSLALRGAFYAAAGLALLLATAFITFLGYRIVTLRVVRRSLAVYLIFLPLVVLVSSIVAALFLAAPRG